MSQIESKSEPEKAKESRRVKLFLFSCPGEPTHCVSDLLISASFESSSELLLRHVTFLTIDQEQNLQTNQIRVAEVVRGHGGPPPKRLDSDENFKPEHMLFCRESRFVAIYALFGDLWVKKSLFG